MAFRCAFQVVGCPTCRRRILGGRIEERLEQMICEVIEEKEAWPVERDAMADPVRLLAEVDPRFGIHRLVKAVKGRISRLLGEEFPVLKSKLSTVGTNSSFVATVGGAPLEAVERSVENQKNW
ncbi:IS200/IS605 family transposase [Streptosporangium sp. NBC_01639]|uniref:IS200/IS605 family transposase n=1 Tax=Streptosporangium sp. NBC_01639 TaxID=2975948 RepID=UPI003866CB4E|nr:IS200/IS605 family transposase [Streptosporangium sp. NBC_01639]